MRTRIARLATTAAFSLAYVVYASIATALGVDFFAEMHAFMGEPDVLLVASADAPRLYVYSDKDEMVRAEVVEKHVRRVRGLGYTTRVEKFVGSRHVQHARSDPDRYWGAVRETWSEACKRCTRARL
ncbi:TMEM53 family protein [Pleurotus pulmonarius]